MTLLVWPNGTASEPTRSDGYGPRASIQTKAGLTRPFHVGSDHHSIGVLRAIGDGTVIESGWIDWAGYYVLIYLGEIDGVRTWVRYCHLRAPSHLVRGDTVNRGDQVGYEGDTGQAGGVHLHWEIYRGRVDRGDWDNPGTTIDPRQFILAHLTSPIPATGEEEDEAMRAVYFTQRTPKRLYLVAHPDIGADLKTGETRPAGKVTYGKGYMETDSPGIGGAWSRLYPRSVEFSLAEEQYAAVKSEAQRASSLLVGK